MNAATFKRDSNGGPDSQKRTLTGTTREPKKNFGRLAEAGKNERLGLVDFGGDGIALT